MMNLSLSELMLRIQQSDQRAFQILFDRLWEPMYQFAYSILKDPSLSKDLVQEVWIDFWARRKKIQNDNIQAYLFKAVRFKVYKELKNDRIDAIYKEQLFELLTERDHADTYIEYGETHSLVSQFIEALPDKCKEVFKLSRYNGLKNSEIAQKLGISVKTVENHITRALKLLKEKTALSLLLTFLFYNVN